MDFSASYFSSEGGRDLNEDAVFLCEHGNGLIAIVADGLGGMSQGDKASKLAVKTVSSSLAMEHISEDMMNAAVSSANSEICSAGGKGMGSTIAALWMQDKKACACHVGDSRIYQLRNGSIIYQSKDHSLSQVAVMVGEITPDEIRGHRDRNRLVRALGTSDTVKPDTAILDVQCGDAFLLCSDGFWEHIVENDIVKYLDNSTGAADWLDKMKAHVLSRQMADSDNSTAAAIIIDKG